MKDTLYFYGKLEKVKSSGNNSCDVTFTTESLMAKHGDALHDNNSDDILNPIGWIFGNGTLYLKYINVNEKWINELSNEENDDKNIIIGIKYDPIKDKMLLSYALDLVTHINTGCEIEFIDFRDNYNNVLSIYKYLKMLNLSLKTDIIKVLRKNNKIREDIVYLLGNYTYQLSKDIVDITLLHHYDEDKVDSLFVGIDAGNQIKDILIQILVLPWVDGVDNKGIFNITIGRFSKDDLDVMLDRLTGYQRYIQLIFMLGFISVSLVDSTMVYQRLIDIFYKNNNKLLYSAIERIYYLVNKKSGNK